VGKQNEIPTTAFVPPYSPEVALSVWGASVAGFAQGAQAVKQSNGFRSIRIGNLVYLQGEIEVGTLLNTELPVTPRTNGFLTTYAADGTMKGVPYIAKTVDLTGLAAGTYYITGQYLAQARG